jgi:hypothetical protein
MRARRRRLPTLRRAPQLREDPPLVSRGWSSAPASERPFSSNSALFAAGAHADAFPICVAMSTKP